MGPIYTSNSAGWLAVRTDMPAHPGLGTTYKSQANPALSASPILAIDLWDFGCTGLRAARIVRLGAYRCTCAAAICAGAQSNFWGLFSNSRRAPRREVEETRRIQAKSRLGRHAAATVRDPRFGARRVRVQNSTTVQNWKESAVFY